jgi:molybdopterin-guanine dinucleotide biosynthesis protein A
MPIDSFILIGGSSSRFGSPKARIEIEGQPLLRRTAETIQTALPGTKITLVASSPEQFLGLGTDLPFIFDLHPGRGPWSGLHAALAYARTDWAFVTACDYPFLSVDLLKYLAGLIDGAFDAIVPTQPDGRLQPLIAFYRTNPCLAVAEEFMTNNRSTPALRTIFDRVNTRIVSFDEIAHLPNSENFFTNINTPADVDSTTQLRSESDGD